MKISKLQYQNTLKLLIEECGYWSEAVYHLNKVCLDLNPSKYHQWHNEVWEEYRINERIYNN